MLFSKPLIFLACSECGGAANSSQSAVDPTKSSKYPALSAANKLKLLGVAPAGSQQQFLTGTTLPGFVWMDEDGEALVTNAPTVTLPDAMSGAVSRLVVGTADAISEWKMMVAPPTGNYVLVVKEGAYSLVGTGAVPLDMLGPLGGTNSPLILAGIRNLGGSVWSTDKLAVSPQRVLVGDGDGVSVKSLPTDEYLVHPLGQFSMLRLETYTQLDDLGEPISGGIAAGSNDGVNNVLAIYNISSKKFFRAPVRFKKVVESTALTPVADNGAWQALDPHCKVTGTFNYPDVYFSAGIRTGINNSGGDPDDYRVDFALFVDGVIALDSNGDPKIWDIQGYKDNFISGMLTGATGLSLGTHTIEIRCRKNAVADQALKVVNSTFEIFSVL